MTARADERRRPLTREDKIVAAGVALVNAGYGVGVNWAAAGVAFQNLCIACENHDPPSPTDYSPLYGIIPVAGAWIQVGRTAAHFPEDRASGFSNAAMSAELMPYLIPGLVELTGLALILVGSLQAHHRRGASR